jgi:hypothetical protein
MAKSERKCPNEYCQMAGKWTTLSVCPKCHRATVHAIYQPQAPAAKRRRPSGASRPISRPA